MGEDRRISGSPEALLELAAQGGERAFLAARRAAALAERDNPGLALKALALARQIEPLDPAPRLAAARLYAEQGDLAAARAEAREVPREAVHAAARARSAVMLRATARMDGDHAGAPTHCPLMLPPEGPLLAPRRPRSCARPSTRRRGRGPGSCWARWRAWTATTPGPAPTTSW